MADISSISMVSYYNSLAMYRQPQQTAGQQQLAQQVQHQGQAQQGQQHAVATSPDGGQQYWYGYPHGAPHAAHHHQAVATQQYLDHPEILPAWTHHHPHYTQYQLQYQHQQACQQHHHQQAQIAGVTDWSGDETNTAVRTGETSPPGTVSGSEVSSPGTSVSPPNSNNGSVNATRNTSGNNTGNNTSTTPMRPTQSRSPYDWLKKTSYQSQPNPGKTRTKDKYRVVYTDHQRLELEKEFHYNRYITMRRKAELAATLQLSDRQVKIWFQNRRAKERKQAKKREEQKDTKPIDNAMAALNIGGMGTVEGAGGSGMIDGLMHTDGSPAVAFGHTAPQALTLSHGPPPLQAHPHQHAHPQTVSQRFRAYFEAAQRSPDLLNLDLSRQSFV